MSIPVPSPPGGAVNAGGMVGIGPPPPNDTSTTTFNPDGTIVVTTNGVPVTYGDASSTGTGGVSDSTSPQSTAKLSFSTEASFTSASVTKQGGTTAFPDPKDLKTLLERTLPRITEKKGIASYTVFDNERGTRAYKTISFFAEGLKMALSQSETTLKLNRGFTQYSPDDNPVQLLLLGRLLTGDDWDSSQSLLNTDIVSTDWFSKFLTDYKQRLSSSAGFRNNTSLFFSFQDVFLQVYFTNLDLNYEASSPLVSSFSATMVVREGRVIYRPDLRGSGEFPHPPSAPVGSPIEEDITDDELDPLDPTPPPGGVSGDAVIGAVINPDGSIAVGPTPITSKISLPQTIQAFAPAAAAVGPGLANLSYGSEFNAQLKFLLSGGTRSRNG